MCAPIRNLFFHSHNLSVRITLPEFSSGFKVAEGGRPPKIRQRRPFAMSDPPFIKIMNEQSLIGKVTKCARKRNFFKNFVEKNLHNLFRYQLRPSYGHTPAFCWCPLLHTAPLPDFLNEPLFSLYASSSASSLTFTTQFILLRLLILSFSYWA